jgi:hypothetical protein
MASGHPKLPNRRSFPLAASLRGATLLLSLLVALHALSTAAHATDPEPAIPLDLVGVPLPEIPSEQLKPWEIGPDRKRLVNPWFQGFDPLTDSIRAIAVLPRDFNYIFVVSPSDSSKAGYKIYFGIEDHTNGKPIGHPSLALWNNREGRPVCAGGELKQISRNEWNLNNVSGRVMVQYPSDSDARRIGATSFYLFKKDIQKMMRRGFFYGQGMILGERFAQTNKGIRLIEPPYKLDYQFGRISRGELHNENAVRMPDEELVRDFRRKRRAALGRNAPCFAGDAFLDIVDEGTGGAFTNATATAVTAIGAEPLVNYAAAKDREAWEKYPLWRGLLQLPADIVRALITNPALDYLKGRQYDRMRRSGQRYALPYEAQGT